MVFLPHRRAARGHRLEAVDPGGAIWDALGPERVIGCVVYPAAEVEAPGVIRHVEGDRFSLGEPSGEKSERVAAALARHSIAAGLQAPVRTDIRNEIWVKLWGNLSFNPISALTGGTLEEIVADAGTRARRAGDDGRGAGDRREARRPLPDRRRPPHRRAPAAVGAHKTSMLQDLERGRPMEIDALVTAVQELGRLTGVPTPTIDIVLALVRQRARLLGCYG